MKQICLSMYAAIKKVSNKNQDYSNYLSEITDQLTWESNTMGRKINKDYL